ncbi:MAG: 4Fe-4S binding protein [Planctomycetota bacterium]|jgi:carbon-monoxide dehydrogenase iron sulfur subunit|nr:4Fe-4S binding protein [Planctomycetota bacterium]
MKRIFIDREKCQGCLGCAVACMAEHNPAGKSVYDLDLGSRENSVHNNVLLDAAKNPTPVLCRHCDDPDCVRACMSGAMGKDPASGRVGHDRDRCASCYMCVMSCPHGVLKVDLATRRIIQKCDYCGDRDSPRCADECPSGALEYKEVEA